MASPLEDLDELILRCRDLRAREFIKEAVASYRAGAFRAAIVGAWIAVCFDLMEKFRELALTGDKEAEMQVQEVDSLRRAGDVARALKFERGLLDVAKDKFELISPLEFVDLERLQADRNRCAHPSLTADETAYTPSAELARLHIHSAVTHLLQHPPAQGKIALNLLMNAVSSEYFPSGRNEAKVAFMSGPLRRPRESLIRNFVQVLVKRVLKEAPQPKLQGQLLAALMAVEEMHPEQYSRVQAATLSQIFRTVRDDSLHVQLDFVLSLRSSWGYLDPDIVQRLQLYVCDLPAEQVESLPALLDFLPLQLNARTRMSKLTIKEVSKSIFFKLPPDLSDWLIDQYLKSDSVPNANEWTKELTYYTRDYSSAQVRRILTEAARNTNIANSSRLDGFINGLRKACTLPNEEFDRLLSDGGLSTHLL